MTTPKNKNSTRDYFKSPAIISIGFIVISIALIVYQNHLASINPRLVQLGKISMFAEEAKIAEKCSTITAQAAADLKANPADYSKENGLNLQQATENADAMAHYFTVKVERLQRGMKSLASIHTAQYHTEAAASEKDYAAYIADHIAKVQAKAAQLNATKEGFCLEHATGLFLPHVVSKH